MNVLNIGSMNIDYVYSVKKISRPGETVTSNKLEIFPGGKGMNQSIALANAGIPVFHAGKIGPDGELLTEFLRDCRIDTSRVLKSNIRTGNAVIQVSETGENSIVLFGGSNLTVSNDDIGFFLEEFGSGDFLLIQNEINGIDSIIRQAAEKDIKIIFNPAPMSDTVKEYPLHLLEMIILNQTECGELSGITGNPKEMIGSLAETYPGVQLVLTLGNKGVLYKYGEDEYFQDAFPVSAVDTTAAGDTFIGFFLAGLIQGYPAVKCLETGCRAAAIAVTRKGAARSIPDISELPTK